VTDETVIDQEQAMDEESTADQTAVEPTAAEQADVVAEQAEEADAEATAEAQLEADAEVLAEAEASAVSESVATEPESAATEPEPAAEAPSERSSSRRKSAGSSAANDGLRARYHDEVVPALLKEFGYTNPMQVPRLSKIVVNIGLGEALQNAKALDAAVGDLTIITGQKPIVTRARRSIAQFRLRTGNPIGAKVTLRGQRMWDFLERLTRLALPRIRDFRGVPSKSFDGRGNYSLGLREQLAFPEIDYDKIDRLRGLEVSIVTTAKTDEESKRLLQLLGMPFAGQSN
jgi:large subunit ribosomal protein L5